MYIKAKQLNRLPKRLTDSVVIGVWEGRLVWNLAQSEQLKSNYV
jgi:hypothetical protein